MKSFIVRTYLLVIILACLVLPVKLLESYVGLVLGAVFFALYVTIIYRMNGVVFGERIYPWGVEYGNRDCTGQFKKKPKKAGKNHHKRKSR
jgi:hypothetical protein